VSPDIKKQREQETALAYEQFMELLAKGAKPHYEEVAKRFHRRGPITTKME